MLVTALRNCATTSKLCAWRRPWANDERSLVPVEHRTRYVKTYVCLIATGEMNFAKKKSVNLQRSLFLYRWQWHLSVPHRMHCPVSTAAVFTWRHHSVTLHVRSLICLTCLTNNTSHGLRSGERGAYSSLLIILLQKHSSNDVYN